MEGLLSTVPTPSSFFQKRYNFFSHHKSGTNPQTVLKKCSAFKSWIFKESPPRQILHSICGVRMYVLRCMLCASVSYVRQFVPDTLYLDACLHSVCSVI